MLRQITIEESLYRDFKKLKSSMEAGRAKREKQEEDRLKKEKLVEASEDLRKVRAGLGELKQAMKMRS